MANSSLNKSSRVHEHFQRLLCLIAIAKNFSASGNFNHWITDALQIHGGEISNNFKSEQALPSLPPFHQSLDIRPELGSSSSYPPFCNNAETLNTTPGNYGTYMPHQSSEYLNSDVYKPSHPDDGFIYLSNDSREYFDIGGWDSWVSPASHGHNSEFAWGNQPFYDALQHQNFQRGKGTIISEDLGTQFLFPMSEFFQDLPGVEGHSGVFQASYPKIHKDSDNLRTREVYSPSSLSANPVESHVSENLLKRKWNAGQVSRYLSEVHKHDSLEDGNANPIRAKNNKIPFKNSHQDDHSAPAEPCLSEKIDTPNKESLDLDEFVRSLLAEENQIKDFSSSPVQSTTIRPTEKKKAKPIRKKFASSTFSLIEEVPKAKKQFTVNSTELEKEGVGDSSSASKVEEELQNEGLRYKSTANLVGESRTQERLTPSLPEAQRAENTQEPPVVRSSKSTKVSNSKKGKKRAREPLAEKIQSESENEKTSIQTLPAAQSSELAKKPSAIQSSKAKKSETSGVKRKKKAIEPAADGTQGEIQTEEIPVQRPPEVQSPEVTKQASAVYSSKSKASKIKKEKTGPKRKKKAFEPAADDAQDEIQTEEIPVQRPPESQIPEVTKQPSIAQSLNFNKASKIKKEKPGPKRKKGHRTTEPAGDDAVGE